MANKNYIKGTNFERRVKRYYEAEGYYVIKRPRSAFPDLVAMRALKSIPHTSTIKLIECKVKKEYFTKREREEIIALGKRLNAKTYLAYRVGRKLMIEPVSQ